MSILTIILSNLCISLVSLLLLLLLASTINYFKSANHLPLINIIILVGKALDLSLKSFLGILINYNIS